MDEKNITLLNKYRSNVVQMFKDELFPTIVPDERLIHNIEKSIYNATVERSNEKRLTLSEFNLFIELYKIRTLSVKSNLGRIIPLLQSKQCKFSEVGYIDMTDVAPEMWSAIRTKLDKQYQSQFNAVIEASCELYTCFKCRNNKTVVYEVQTRSGDEPMTQFITCITCGNRWRR